MSFIDGHKTQIAAILTLIVGYLVANGVIEDSLGNLILSIVGVFLGVGIAHHEAKKSAAKNDVVTDIDD